VKIGFEPIRLGYIGALNLNILMTST